MSDSSNNDSLQLIIGISISIFAAFLALVDLGGGRYGDDEMIAHNHHGKMYSWYQSKSIKQNQLEGQHDLLVALKKAGVITNENQVKIDTLLHQSEVEIERYNKEKKEIMLGSKAVGKDNWVIEKDGKLGEITGAEEYDLIAEELGKAGDKFDMSALFLNLTVVFGAVSLIISGERRQRSFLAGMIILGVIGCYYGIHAFLIASAI
jgi:hypothetical protein